MRVEMIDITRIPNEIPCDYNSYPYFIAVSSDTLMVVDEKGRCLQEIIKGKDNNGYILAARNDNCLLEAISALKTVIFDKISPIPLIQKYCQ